MPFFEKRTMVIFKEQSPILSLSNNLIVQIFKISNCSRNERMSSNYTAKDLLRKRVTKDSDGCCELAIYSFFCIQQRQLQNINLRRPVIEPGSRRWQRRILPLNHRRL